MRKIFLSLVTAFCLTFLLPVKSQSQSFWFTFNSIPYVEIGGNFLVLNESFDDTLFTDIPIGFQFRFAGKSWTKLHISSNGQIYFGDDPEHLDTLKALIPFGNDLYGDFINHTPAISYESGGCAGAVVMKIQFKECSLKGGGVDDYVNFQVWLYESSGMVEYHYGTGQVSSAPACFGGQSGPMCGIRFTIPGSGSVLYSLLLTSFAFGPDTCMNPNPVYLEGLPEDGMVYIFEPSLVTSTNDAVYVSFPSLTVDRYNRKLMAEYLKKQPGLSQAVIYDMTGRIVFTSGKLFQPSGRQQLPISLEHLTPGLYIIRLLSDDQVQSQTFLL